MQRVRIRNQFRAAYAPRHIGRILAWHHDVVVVMRHEHRLGVQRLRRLATACLMAFN